MLKAPQLRSFYPDLQDERFASALALVHCRFSTNTFPSWELAHPYRVICHNGEINTLMGNVNWMRARESQLASELFGIDLQKVLPVVRPGGSDSATFDNVLELLMLAGRSLPHAVMMMIPEAYQDRDDLSDELKGFYAFHSCLMEPWDGPAAVAFTNGRVVGATLDRNGLRPGRWVETKDGYVVLGSETGMLSVRPENVKRLGRLQPGKIFLVDLERGPDRRGRGGQARGLDPEALQLLVRRARRALQRPRAGAGDGARPSCRCARASSPSATRRRTCACCTRRWRARARSRSARWATTPRWRSSPTSARRCSATSSSSSRRSPTRRSTPIRESIVMSLGTGVGAEGNLLDRDARARPSARDGPADPAQRGARDAALGLHRRLPRAHDRHHVAGRRGPGGHAEAPGQRVRRGDRRTSRPGINILILSDRAAGPERAPIPSLLAVSAVHHHLVREGTRLRAGLVLESGEPREVHHFAMLIGYGASAINPYLMLDTVDELARDGRIAGVEDPDEAERRIVKALGKGLLKTISKMGISTIQSYCGAQIFEAVGLEKTLIDRHFTGTASRIGGIGLDVLAREALDRHARAWPGSHEDLLPVGGVYAWRRDGEHHMWNPETIALLQHAVRGLNGIGAGEVRRVRASWSTTDAARRATLRGLLTFRTDREPVPLDEVEPAKEIVKRFATGAMSLGSISTEAHETLAIAMNRLGGRSNTGEGGEDPRRFTPDANGDLRRSAIKQVASGRFGVTIHYLVNSDQLQIKMAQGAKPGEGGQLPGHKVDEYIGWVRHTTPGVGLISPPPHHDIYSIEDLKQLIYDLRCANPEGSVSVKLVARSASGRWPPAWPRPTPTTCSSPATTAAPAPRR